MALGKLSFFHTFLKNKVQIDKNNCEMMLFVSKQVKSAKNKLDPAKNENQPKKRYMPFMYEAFNF